jgi:hypothetical protein
MAEIKPDPKPFYAESIIAIPGGSTLAPMNAVSVFLNECGNPECENGCRKIVLTINTPIMGFRIDLDLDTAEKLLCELDGCYWRAKEPLNAAD